MSKKNVPHRNCDPEKSIFLFFHLFHKRKKRLKNSYFSHQISSVENNHFSAWKVNEVLLTNEVEL